MKIYIDTANIDEIKEANKLGILDGVTTNPSLIAREKKRTGKTDKDILKEICSTVKGFVSAEVLSLDYDGMMAEADTLSKLAENIVIKIPITEEGLKATKKLSERQIRTNLTLCLSPLQALLVAKAGATYVSPFVGRISDTCCDGLNLVAEIKQIYTNYNISTKIIVASVRDILQIARSSFMAADIITVPYNIIKKLLYHPLTENGIKKFIEDYKNEKM